MSEDANLAATQALFTAFAAQDFDTALEHVADSVVVEFYGPPAIPYAGIHRGRQACRAFFETVHRSVDIHQFEPEEMIAKDDKVFVTGHLRLTAKSTGRTFESDFSHVITLTDGKWVRFRDFMDTAVAVAAFS